MCPTLAVTGRRFMRKRDPRIMQLASSLPRVLLRDETAVHIDGDDVMWLR